MDPDEDDHDTIPVAAMLDALQDIVHESGMIRTLLGDRIIHRVRVHQKEEECTAREALGPDGANSPPPHIDRHGAA